MNWLKILIRDLGLVSEEPMRHYCDNKAAINIAHNLVQHDRTKHIEVDRHFIKEKINEGAISIPFMSSLNQLADLLTKGIPSKMFIQIICKLVMIDIYAPT